MANPIKYVRGFSFSGWQATRPTKPLPGPNIDDELSKISQSIGQTIDGLADIRRADGALKNQIVTVDSLASDLSLGLRTPTRWTPSTIYRTLDTVFVDLEGYYGIYRCQKAHTSGASFPADLAAGRWEVIFSLLDLVDQITPAQAVPYVYELADGTSQINLSTIPGAPNITVSRFVLNGAEQVRGTDKDWYMDGATTLRLVSPIALDDLGLTSPATATVYVTPEGPLLDRFDDRYLLRSEIGQFVKQSEVGRGIGQIVKYENFGGFPALYLDDRLYVRRSDPGPFDVADLWLQRDAAPGGLKGYVNSALKVETFVNSVTDSYEWCILGRIEVRQPGGEHVGIYSQAVKMADCTVWAHCVENRDQFPNPTTGTLGMEVGMFIRGGDVNGLRHAIDVSVNSDSGTAGVNEIASGLRISCNRGNAQIKAGIIIKDDVETAIDLTLLNTNYNVCAIKLNAGSPVSWEGTNYVQTVYDDGALQFRFGGEAKMNLLDADQDAMQLWVGGQLRTVRRKQRSLLVDSDFVLIAA